MGEEIIVTIVPLHKLLLKHNAPVLPWGMDMSVTIAQYHVHLRTKIKNMQRTAQSKIVSFKRELLQPGNEVQLIEWCVNESTLKSVK